MVYENVIMLSLQRIGLLSSRLVKNKLSLHVLEGNAKTGTVRLLSNASETGVKIQNSDLQDVTQKSEYVLEEAVDFSLHGPSSGTSNAVLDQEYHEYTEAVDQKAGTLSEGKQEVDLEENSAAMNCHSSVNLYSCMQTNVPEPCNTDDFTHANYRNMPGENSKLLQKYVADNQNTTHPNRSFHWSAATRAAQAVPQVGTPEGVQGDDCVQYKTWIENCRRFGLTNCDNQLLDMKEGRKTLSQVLAEQEELIRKIAESYGQNAKARVDSVVSKQQIEQQSFVGPCPQGIQGDDCVRFKLWLENCHKFDLKECDEQLESVQSGRKTLKQVFYEQENMIKSIVNQYQQRRSYSTSSGSGPKQEWP